MRQKLATGLQAAGVAIAASSVATINMAAGGIVLSIGLVLFGLAIERGGN